MRRAWAYKEDNGAESCKWSGTFVCDLLRTWPPIDPTFLLFRQPTKRVARTKSQGATGTQKKPLSPKDERGAQECSIQYFEEKKKEKESFYYTCLSVLTILEARLCLESYTSLALEPCLPRIWSSLKRQDEGCTRIEDQHVFLLGYDGKYLYK